MATGPTPARKGFSLSILPKTNIKSTVKYIVNPISKAKQIRVKGNFLSLLFVGAMLLEWSHNLANQACS